MDKYIVDLDKVLDDFEYSELTDNFGSSRTYLAQGGSNYASSSKSRTGDAKHSITNVFHSLNEYLNTDISTKPTAKQPPADSNKENEAQNNNVEVQTGNLLDLSFPESIECKEEAMIITEISENDGICDKNESNCDAVTNLECIDGDNRVKIENDLKNEDFDENKLESEEVNEENEVDGDNNFKLEGIEDEINEKNESVDIKDENIDLKEENIDLKQENVDLEEEKDKVIKFDDKFEIDDSTLNQFLDELEVEFEKENVEEPKINEKEDLNEIKITEKLETDSNIETIERPNNLELSRESFSSDSEEIKPRKIDLIGEPGSTPYNNLYVSKELTLEEVKDAIGKEKETSSSPTFSEASTDTVSDSNDTEVDDLGGENKDVCEGGKIEESRDEINENVEVGLSEAKVEEGVKDEEKGNEDVGEASNNIPVYWLGKQAPLWIPDSEALSCLHCDTRFTVIKRRHHCRACGLVLCSKCCNLKYRLEYLDAEARVCLKCHNILQNLDYSSSSDVSPTTGNSPNRQPNPNNPMEYCSVVPPLQQAGSSGNPPTVMVPVGVLKRKGSKKSNKSVMFCDGIRPGSDLTKLDGDFDSLKVDNNNTDNRMVKSKEIPTIYPETLTFVPKDSKELPPLVSVCKLETSYFCNMYKNDGDLLEVLKGEKLTFALQKNVFVHVKIIDLNCCVNKQIWCFSTEGFLSVGQDEIVYLIELTDGETCLPIDIFNHLNIIYNDALKGTTVSELGISLHDSSSFLDFKNHAGFLYIRPTFQCVQNIIKPKEPFLIGLLIHRWETPWAKIFPLRLMLRLGAEYRYYPCPLISTRFRDSLFVELGHTVITLFADFRNFSYTLTSIRGLSIHMEDKNTIVRIPTNRYDQVMSSMNNSSDHILVFGGNFSTKADSHLVCIQDTQSSTENSYTTHTIDIKNQPKKVIGASFIVFNGALKSTSGLTAKSSIVEDGLMIQISAEDMVSLRESLRNMKEFTIQCGCVNMPSDETVNIIWGDVDKDFNVGVVSPIDNQSLSGVPSIRVHNGKNFTGPGNSKMIRWTEVFILQNTDETSKTRDHPLDISKISDNIAKATCTALVKYLDLLCSNNFFKIGIRATLHVENVSYSAGSNNVKLPPIYMKSLDNELIPVLHRILSNNLGEDIVTLELIFRILNS
nr:zinc finger FYVE domain-containing protein 9 [Onthophagus taurus]